MDTPQARRSTGEIRSLLLTAAGDLFRTVGYEGTSTREIAAQAGVAESMLFRNFGTKADLFDQAVMAPFLDYIDDFISSLARGPMDGVAPEELSLNYVRGMYRLFRDNRDLLSTMGAHQSGSTDVDALSRVSAILDGHFNALTDQVDAYYEQVALAGVLEARLAVRFATALVIRAAQLDSGPADTGAGTQAREDVLVAEMAAFIVRGAGYPSSGYVPGSSRTNHRT